MNQFKRYDRRGENIVLIEKGEESKTIYVRVPTWGAGDALFAEKVPLDFPARENSEVLLAGNPEDDYCLLSNLLENLPEEVEVK